MTSICLGMSEDLARGIANLECDPNCSAAPNDGHVAGNYLIRRTGFYHGRISSPLDKPPVLRELRFRCRVEVACARCRHMAYVDVSSSAAEGSVHAAEETGELWATPQMDPKTLEQRRWELEGPKGMLWHPLAWTYEPKGKAPGKPRPHDSAAPDGGRVAPAD